MQNKTFLYRLCCALTALLVFPALAFAQNITITGNVSDEADVIIGATVKAVPGSAGTVTDLDGNYKLTVPASTKQLVFSYVGYKQKTVDIQGRTTINVKMESANQMLDEVVSIGYAKVKRKDLTGSASSVSASELAAMPVNTAAQALSGKAAGVSVVTQSGAPGAEINITVRGGTSITQSSKPLYIVDGFEMDNALQQIDINDIESIDIMKDASATAIYGARGANGVILITTKSASAGKTNVTYNAYVSFNKLGKKLDVLGVEDYTLYQYELQTLAGNAGNFASYFGGNVDDADFYTGAYDRIHSEYGNRAGIDWQDEVFGGTGFSQNHNLSISGGNDKTKYLLSYNYTGEDGIMSKHGYDKNSIRLKLNHELWKGVRFDFSTSFQNTMVEGGGSLGGALKNTILQPVTGGARYTNEELLKTDISNEMSLINSSYDIINPILTNDAVDNKKYTRLFTANGGIEFDFLKDFTWRTAFSYQWSQVRQDYWDDGRTSTAKNFGGPYGYRNNNEKYSWQLTNTLSWGHKFGLHKVDALLGQETYYTNSMNLNNEYHNFPNANFGLNNVSMGSAYKYGSGVSERGLVSMFGRVSYNYNERYLLTATLRADGSSKFAKGHQWGYFPSASVAWRVIEEDFMKNQKLFSNLKLRFGFGTTGNDNIDNNMYTTDYSAGHYVSGKTDVPTLVPGSTLGNPVIKWEKTTTLNLGLDFGMFNGRLNGTVDIYRNTSSNLLIKNRIPSSTGYSYQYQNLASVRNQGVEFVLNSVNVRSKAFTWTTDFNISFNKSKVVSLYGDGSGSNSFIQNYDSRVDFLVEVGKPLGQFYGYKYAGVYTTDDFTQNADGTYTLNAGVPYLKGKTKSSIKPGDVKYVTTAGETDKDGNPIWSTNDRTVIGNAAPDFTGGLNNTFKYKNFDLSVFCTFSVGNDIFNMSSQRFIGPYLPNQNTLNVMKDRYHLIDPATGKESTNLARLAELNPQQYNAGTMWSLHSENKIAITDALDYYIEDGSYLRISTITLGYTFPKLLISKIGLQSARVYCTLNNIATITGYSGYDPEVSASSSSLTPGIDNSSYPKAKSFVLGLNLTF